MYIAVCDDQISELDILTHLLDLWQKDRRKGLRYKTFRSAAELLSVAEKEPFTLYILDVMMPGTDGLAAAREIRVFDSSANIIFLTSSPGFAYESYGVHAMDYLLKPIRSEILFPILDRIHQQEQNLQDSITVKSGTTLIRIPFSQLTYVEVNGKHLYFNLSDGSIRQIYGTLKEYEPQLLCRPEFMQVHRSYIVNMLQIAELSPSGISTFSGKNIPVSRLLYSQLQKDYMKLLFSRREV